MLKAASFFKEERDPFYKRGAQKERAKAQQEKLDMALDMKKDGIPVEQIAKFTKLPIAVIEKL